MKVTVRSARTASPEHPPGIRAQSRGNIHRQHQGATGIDRGDGLPWYSSRTFRRARYRAWHRRLPQAQQWRFVKGCDLHTVAQGLLPGEQGVTADPGGIAQLQHGDVNTALVGEVCQQKPSPPLLPVPHRTWMKSTSGQLSSRQSKAALAARDISVMPGMP